MSYKLHNPARMHRQTIAQALVEMALLLPIILLLILGAMDFGRLFMTKLILTNAAREGANFLSYHPDDFIDGYLLTIPVIQNEADSSGITVDPGEIFIADCCTHGQPVTVTITQNVDLIFDSFLDTMGVVDGPISITSAVTMMVQ